LTWETRLEIQLAREFWFAQAFRFVLEYRLGQKGCLDQKLRRAGTSAAAAALYGMLLPVVRP